jgi:hypothetical protein
VCYFLYLASPLTLSEIRSMLAPGITADLASYPAQQILKSMYPAAQTVALVQVGRCSCDLVRPRLTEPREDERHLRERYRGLKAARSKVIAALERHRRIPGIIPLGADWPIELSKFVAEHARNAGPTLYYLSFSADAGPLPVLQDVRRIQASVVTAEPRNWLPEESPTLVTR